MAGVTGRSGRKRKDGPRDGSGRLLSMNRCACGDWKTAKSPRCHVCAMRNRPGRIVLLCDCGRPRTRQARQCKECYSQALLAQQRHTCEMCGVEFWRVRKERDTCRFCSKTCYGLSVREASRRERAERRSCLEREQRQRPCLECGQPGLASGRRRHAHCQRVRASRYMRERQRELRSEAAYQRAKHPPRQHVCPTCGESFTTEYGDYRRVFCSHRCSKQQPNKSMGALSRIPSLEERNQLAAMMAMVKQARRRMAELFETDEGAGPD